MLVAEYAKRLSWKLDIRECEVKKELPAPKRKTEEAKLLLEAAREADRIVALDERGQLLSSREFAGKIGAWAQEGLSHLAFIVGGSDGLDEAALRQSHLTLSFGRMSLSHLLARAVLTEQIYRAQTILSGHPYHRD